MVAAAPFGKRRIALEKLAAHVTGMVAACVFLGVVTYVGTQALGTVPGDALPVEAAVGIATLGRAHRPRLRIGSLGPGAVRRPGGAAGVAGAAIARRIRDQRLLERGAGLQIPADLSWFHWTANHLPLAGQYDWLSLVPVAVVTVILFAVGVVAFDKRDLGSTSAIPMPAMPGALLGVRGPTGRSFGERLPQALAWGIGLGLFRDSDCGFQQVLRRHAGAVAGRDELAQDHLQGL